MPIGERRGDIDPVQHIDAGHCGGCPIQRDHGMPEALAAEESERGILKAFIRGGAARARPPVNRYDALVGAWNAASDGERRRLLIAAEIVEDDPKLPPWST
jgi:hypothetical protein